MCGFPAIGRMIAPPGARRHNRVDVAREHGGLNELAAGPQTNGVAPAFVERFVKQLNITFKAVKLYPLSSNIPRDNARVALEVLHDILKRFPGIVPEVPRAFERAVHGRAPLLRIGWGMIRPQAATPAASQPQ